MIPRTLLDILTTAERLKDTTRHCYTTRGRHESVAEHSWMAALMAFFLRDEFPNADMDKVMCMCIIHDLGECFTGDTEPLAVMRMLVPSIWTAVPAALQRCALSSVRDGGE